MYPIVTNIVVAEGGLLSPNVGLAFWMTLTFLILLFLLRRFAWGPITKALIEREEKIESSIQSAERALAEAKQIQSDNAVARRQAEQDAQKIMREAREAADKLRAEEIDKTRAKVADMQAQATAEIAREKDSALNELREEVADLAVKAAEKILNKNIDADSQRGLIDGFIDSLPNN